MPTPTAPVAVFVATDARPKNAKVGCIVAAKSRCGHRTNRP